MRIELQKLDLRGHTSSMCTACEVVVGSEPEASSGLGHQMAAVISGSELRSPVAA